MPKLIISIFYLIIISSKNYLDRILFYKISGKLLIQYYHSVPNDQKEEYVWQLDTLSKYRKFIHIDFVNRLPAIERYYGILFEMDSLGY